MRITTVSLLLAVAGCAGSRQGSENLESLDRKAVEHRAKLHSWARPPVSAGDVADARPDRDPDAIAALRAEGPAALERLLATYDVMPSGTARTALGATIDRVAAQRYATVSRMYWYTDLEAAKRAARAAGKPILSLRMLGRLDEDLSCANSRLFRVVLYANRSLSAFMRDKFVLHWSSERPVPRVVIDYGDGRKLQRTITGNSIHYVLDAEGRPIDALPGVYAPAVFRAELEDSLAIAQKLEADKERPRSQVLAEEHRKRLAVRQAQWKQIGAIAVPLGYGDRLRTPGEAAMMTTVTKAAMETPLLRVVSLGVSLGQIADDPAAWAQLGLRLMPGAMPSTKEEAALAKAPPWRAAFVGGKLQRAWIVGSHDQSFTVPTSSSPMRVPPVLDESSRALVKALAPLHWRNRFGVAIGEAKPRVADKLALERIISRLERDVVADTAKNELAIRTAVREQLQVNPAADLAALNKVIYASVFKTPAADAWLGLAPSSFLALPGDGVVTKSR